MKRAYKGIVNKIVIKWSKPILYNEAVKKTDEELEGGMVFINMFGSFSNCIIYHQLFNSLSVKFILVPN